MRFLVFLCSLLCSSIFSAWPMRACGFCLSCSDFLEIFQSVFDSFQWTDVRAVLLEEILHFLEE